MSGENKLNTIKNVLITGGAGYVGSVLVPKLLKAGYNVKVIDLYIFGEDVLDSVKDNPNLKQVKGDIRSLGLLEKEIPGIDAVIHLACISNDPSFELDPKLGKSINYDSFRPLVRICKKNNVKRFIYASSSSVYGIKNEENVTEDLPLEPLTDYSKYKMLCEKVLQEERTRDFTTLILRPSTVCGYSPRQRLDLIVNIFTNHAVNKGKITVNGGKQKRPNIHIEDMTDLYVRTLEYPTEKISGRIYNAGYENYPIMDIAKIVQHVVGGNVPIESEKTDDNRSYHVSSEKILKELGFAAKHSVEEAVSDICNAFKDGRIPDPDNIKHYNISVMKKIRLK